MLTKLTIRNFKRFEEVEIELGNPVVLIGPNNSGKTSAMQALALWDIGLRRWRERRAGGAAPEKRPGVTVNRRDLVTIPVPNANLLWRELHTRHVRLVDGRQRTDNICIDVLVEGSSGGEAWQCGLEFDYANQESFYCRPLRVGPGRPAKRMPIPEPAMSVEVAYLPPMSGLASAETRLDPGAVNVRIGEGRTAEVLRNLCFRIHEQDAESWERMAERIERLFGVELDPPVYVEGRGEISMRYRERGIWLDLSSSGRGLQQTLLILAYMYAHPGAVLLLDEPDAHLEILRQREVYSLIREVAAESHSQIVVASHSEVLLGEAAGTDTVIAFVGKPHRIDDGGSQVAKALTRIGFNQYLQAELTGWVLYLEGSTDLAILRAFANRLGHEAAANALARPFVQYVGDRLSSAELHFHGLREACPGLRGIALLDKLPEKVGADDGLERLAWSQREIENYLCSPAALDGYAADFARQEASGPLFEESEAERHVEAMRASAAEVEKALAERGQPSPWSGEAKASSEFLAPLFETFAANLGGPNLMAKANFHRLAEFVPQEVIDPEVVEKLDAIARVATAAEAAEGES